MGCRREGNRKGVDGHIRHGNRCISGKCRCLALILARIRIGKGLLGQRQRQLPRLLNLLSVFVTGIPPHTQAIHDDLPVCALYRYQQAALHAVGVDRAAGFIVAVLQRGNVDAGEILLINGALIFGGIMGMSREIDYLRTILEQVVQRLGLGCAPSAAVGCVRQR